MKEGKKVVAKKINYVFERVEKKYLLDREKYDLLIKYIEDYMTEDEYGVHTICNIYYDTDTYDLIRHSIEKCRYKEKLRVRSYGSVDKRDYVFIEIKLLIYLNMSLKMPFIRPLAKVKTTSI